MFKGEPIPFKEKFEKELEDMNKPGTEAYKRAEEMAKEFKKIFIDAEKNDEDDGDGISIHIIEI